MRHALPLVSLLAVVACGAKDDDTADTGLPLYTSVPVGTAPTSVPLTGAPTGTTSGSLAIAGSWTDTWGTEHVIDDASWSMGFPGYAPAVFAVSQYDNAAQHVIAQNDASNAYFPGLWSRMDWHVDPVTSELWFCQTGYNQASAADALALAEADATDLAYGCGGFGWTQLLP